MQLDDTKHKVYIYDLDAELSDSETSDDGRLVFLPDIQKHLRQSRIPPMILANSDGELAGNKQMVLYNVPTSLTIPEEQDNVRKAIIETRARARAKIERERGATSPNPAQILPIEDVHTRGWPRNSLDTTDQGITKSSAAVGMALNSSIDPHLAYTNDDPDAMDLG